MPEEEIVESTEETPAPCGDCGGELSTVAERENGRCEDCEDKHDICSDCNEDFLKEDMVNGRCESCSEDYTSCERCGEEVDRDDVCTVHTGRYSGESSWCSDCRSNHAWSCNDCDAEFSDRVDSFTVGHSQVCHSCYADNYFCCDGCSDHFHNDDRHSDFDGEDYYCADCYVGHSPSALIQPYHSERRPKLIFYGNPKEIYYGVELEVNASEDEAEAILDLLHSPDREHVFLEADSSITGGYEIITHPHTLAEQRKLWKEFLVTPKPGVTSFRSGQCGMHVHVERAKLTRLQVGKIVDFIHNPDHGDFITAIAQREPGTYCARRSKKITDEPRENHDAVAAGTDEKTIEIRIFRGVLRADRFFKNLEFVDALVHWTKEVSYKELTYQKFVAYVVRHRNEYKALHAYLIQTGYAARPRLTLKEIIRQCA